MQRTESQARSLKFSHRSSRRKRSESSDQLRLDFGDAHELCALSFAAAHDTLEDCFRIACQAEEEGCLEAAAAAYRRGIAIAGRHAVLCFNLGNVLYALKQPEEAAESFRQAVNIEPAYCQAWNNLGVTLDELGEVEEAQIAFRTAIRLDPCCADAYYNLADLLDELGKEREAREHWRHYLQHDSRSHWAQYARSRL